MNSLHRTVTKLFAALCLGLMAMGAGAFELRGFRGVMWGEGAEALGAGAVLAYTEGDLSCYQRDRENLLFGDSALNGVRYCFHQDRLVLVTLDAAVDQKALVAEFQHTYGRPDARTHRVVSWGNKASGARAELVAQGDAAARLSIYSSKIEPALAQRIHTLATADTPQRVAAGS